MNKNYLTLFILVTIAVYLLSGCASKKVMKNCDKVGDKQYYLCEEP